MKKLEDRRTVLWTTSHGVTDKYYVGEGVTFDLYAKTIFDYALHNPDMGFTVWPSVGLIVEMLRSNVCIEIQAGEKGVKHFDGKNGWRIKEFIKEKYLEKET